MNSNTSLTAPQGQGVFKSSKRIRQYNLLAIKLAAGEFGTPEHRNEGTSSQRAFWQGYDGQKPPNFKSDEYVAYRLGRGARDYADREQGQPCINGCIVTETQFTVWGVMPENCWTDAAFVATRCDLHPYAVGRALQELWDRGLIQRKPDTPPSYRKST